jgi:hypothetical protein
MNSSENGQKKSDQYFIKNNIDEVQAFGTTVSLTKTHPCCHVFHTDCFRFFDQCPVVKTGPSDYSIRLTTEKNH